MIQLALYSKTHSSHTPCPTPIVSTYSGPSSSHTVETEGTLSESAQLNSEALSAAPLCVCQALEQLWEATNTPLVLFMSQRDPFLVDWTKKMEGKHFHARRIQPGKKRALHPNGPLQNCAGAPTGTESFLKTPGGKKQKFIQLKR